MRITLISVILAFNVSACKNLKEMLPSESYSSSEAPQAPDYSKPDAWIAHPSKADEADEVPIGSLNDRQAEADADVFFIHPTTFYSKKAWNATIDDAELNKKTAESTIRHQASIFNAAGRIYAPLYRQVTLGAFFNASPEDFQPALELAYSDVKAAFQYYLKNYNAGRPVIIASHSQGSAHAIRLLKEFFDGKKLSKKLITAYIAGWAVPADTFAFLRPCSTATDTECYNSWCTYAWGYTPESRSFFNNAICTNPVTWKLDSNASRQEDHKGLVLRKYNKIYPKLYPVKANPSKGFLWVGKPDFFGAAFISRKNYHIADYNLFWLDVRQNAVQRVEAYFSK